MDLITPDGFIVEKPDVYRRNKNLLRQHWSRSPNRSTSRDNSFGRSVSNSPNRTKKINSKFPKQCLKELLTFAKPPDYVLFTLDCLNSILINIWEGEVELRKCKDWKY